MKFLRGRIMFLLCILAVVYVYLFYLLVAASNDKERHQLRSVTLSNVVVHLDLKGAPLKLKYLKSILPMLKKYGANGLLIEYEDMFPYEGKLVNISAKNCYRKNELKHFLKAAVKLKFNVIPLVQTFGHMEHVLKLREFKHLREVAEYPDSICPSKKESRALIGHMLEQIISFHNGVAPLDYIHIGCDEVYNIYKCPQCRESQGKPFTYDEFFTNYIRSVADTVQKLSPETTVLIWDDMLRFLSPIDFMTLNSFSNVEPVYWAYGDEQISHKSIFHYKQKFKNIWIASAFKGADGMAASVPILAKRITNHFNMMNFILNYKFGGEKRVYEFKGIILTGWSRYSHFDPLCELFPVAIPSLIANLLLIDKFKKGFDEARTIDIITFYIKHLLEDLNQGLHCSEEDIDFTFVHKTDIQNCAFESVDLYNLINKYETWKLSIEKGFCDNYKTIASLEYYTKANFIRIDRREEFLKWLQDNLVEVNIFEKALSKVMKRYYSDDVIDEYSNCKLYSLKKKLEYHLNLILSNNSIGVWDRNPFNMSV